jgi:Thioredoxin like C-terminal domain
MVIQQLLAEAGSTGAGTDLVSVAPRGLEVAADWASLRSPENYTGHERTEGFASPGGPVPDKPHVYTVPARLGLNQWALSGDWTMAEEAATLNAARGQIACRFCARDLNLVMGPAAPGSPVRCRVLIDGQPPGEAHGTDTDADGNGILTPQRVYQLIRQPGPITERTFEITFPDPAFRPTASPSDKSGEKPKGSATKRWPPRSSSATRPPKCTSATSTKSSVCIPRTSMVKLISSGAVEESSFPVAPRTRLAGLRSCP